MKASFTDGNAVGYAAQNAKKLTNSSGEPVQAIFHSIKSMWNLGNRLKGYTPFVLWDTHCQWRYDIYPEYKGKRDTYPKQIQMREEYRLQRPLIQEAFKLLGIRQVQKEGYEADDIAGIYSKKFRAMPINEGHKAVLFTGDKDWLQLVHENVVWHEVVGHKTISMKNFEKETGLPTTKGFLESKILQGDSSDAITGVGGIGALTADPVILHFGSIRQMISAYKSGGPFLRGALPEHLSRARNKINSFCNNEKGQHAILKRNVSLMNLMNVKAHDGKLDMTLEKPNKEGFIDFCLEHELVTLADKAERIINEIHNRGDL
jgi:5'-3' exonuclease